ncbi:non-ribosomal peptide synthetase [Flavobacterium algoritolerans]|uniref:Amino acid adenylation domain-containing protein n=1 Tax=Flavobacterium algoritolerans TaxID=3041254 RepID=A0ABT6VCN0_9FLAO|nr:non-ribosomal peptide synthetase [Flavobacterium algoritolerans]MDI5895994.1 amino acid adenylation domain-containing protein [Flavobacterium algoritolerans]
MLSLLKKLNKLNVRLDLFNGKLDIQAPKGVMTDEILEEIKLYKNELIEFITLHKSKENKGMLIPQVTKRSGYVLSSSQRRLWLLSQFEGGNVAYNMPSVYELKGNLDIISFQNAFFSLIDRHESLRTLFKEDESGELSQIILNLEEIKFELQYEDFRDEKHSIERIKEIIKKEIEYPFDLSSDSLLRAKLVRTSNDTHIFIGVMHHIIGDGWSSEIMTNELFELYQAYVKGNSNPLPILKLQYKDYAAWQQDQLNNDSIKVHENYWLRQFQGEIPILDLPVFQTRPTIKTYAGKSIKKFYKKELLKDFNALCQAQGSTLFMGLLATVKVLLYRYTNQKDIVIGSPIAGREHEDLQNQIGFYVNTLALRTQFEGEDTFKELLVKVKEVVLGGYEHQIYPFDKLVEHLPLNRDMSHNPLFDVMVRLQSANLFSENLQKLPEVVVRELELEDEILSKFDLEFAFRETDRGLGLTLTFNTDIYSTDFVANILSHVEVLMDSIVSNIDDSISSLAYLKESERNQVLLEFNDTDIFYANDKNIIDLFYEQVERTPNNIAVVFEDVSLTYKELNEKTNQLASYLTEKHTIQPDDLIGIKLKRNEKLIIAILGVLKSGAAYVPIDINYPQERITYIEKDSNNKFVIDEKEFERFDKVQAKYSHYNCNACIKNSSLVYLIYTSGSTGIPKGIMMEHISMYNLIIFHNKQFPANSIQRVSQFTSISFDVSFQEIFSTLVSGATLYPVPEAVRADSAELSAFIKRNSIDTVFLPTSYFKILMDVKAFNTLITLNNIKNIIVAGEQLVLSNEAINILQKSDTKLHNHYGPAETHVVTTIVLQGSNLRTSPAIGFPISNTQILLLDDNLNPVAVGVTGKLYISGVALARGYLNQGELTSQKFIKNPFKSCQYMYDTGDLGRWLPDGNIEFLGRRDHQVKIRGYRIELGEIESAIADFSDSISQVIVLASDVNGEKSLVAYIVSSNIDKKELRVFLTGKLPEYMVPGFYIELDQLPLTPNGKIDRKLLPSVQGSDLILGDYTAPVTDTQRSLVAIWQEVLGIDTIGIRSNFFELGGHSLIISQVINRIHKQLGKSVSFREFFNHPSIEELSGILEDNHYETIPRANLSDSYPLTASQTRLWVLSQLEGGSLAYNMPGAVKVVGDIDSVQLEKSFRLLIQRHEILRTCFKTDSKGDLTQFIIAADQIDFRILEKDFSQINDSDGIISDYLEQKNREPFDLEQAPLVRASLLKIKNNEFIFFLSQHHIIGDGWSLELLISEVIKVYNSLIESGVAPLIELGIQYKDYALWINSKKDEQKYQVSEQYWLDQFSGELPVLELPSFKTRPLIQTYNGESLTHKYSEEFLNKLKDFSRSCEATLFMTLTAGINALLHRYTGQDDIIMGTPVAGREHPDLENQLGLYLNTLALRSQFKQGSSFTDLVLAQKQTLLGAYEHQNYPFDALIDKLNLKRDTSRSALFDVLVILQNQEQLNNINNEKLISVEVQDYDLKSRTSKFDLSFAFKEKDGLSLTIEYNTDIYDLYLVERVFSHFENLLTALLEQPEMAVSEADYLTAAEKTELLVSFNATDGVYPQDKTIIDLFEDQVIRTPDNIALIFEDTEITYRELNERSNQLGSYLRDHYGIKADDLVGIKLERSEWMLITILGVLKSGGAYVPIDPGYPQERISYIEKDSESKVVIDESVLETFFGIQSNYSQSNPLKINTANDLAYVIYTSGTTGNPKGVMIENKSVVNFLYGMSNSISVNDKEHLLAITSISFDISVLELFWTLTQGIVITLKSDNSHLSNFNHFLNSSQESFDFSFFYFSSQESSNTDKYKFLKESAVYADKNDFAAVWLPERHFHEFGGIFPNPSVLGAALSTITKKIEIRSGSIVLPLHDVVRVAEEWSVVDNLSNGRTALSIASGWHADDFVLQPENYLERQKIMYNQIEEFKTLWEGGSLKRVNGLKQDIDVKVFPRPINTEIDIYITSGGNSETFRSAGKIGANILTHLLGQEINVLASNIKIYKQALRENGYDDSKAKISLMLHTFIGDDLDKVKSISRGPFKSYLKSSLGLIQNLFKDFGKDAASINENDLEDLLELAFERYWQTAALLGTKESCKNILSRIYSAGVTEIACLLDFGIDDHQVIKGLDFLTELKNNYSKDRIVTNSKIGPITSMQITPSYLETLLEDDNSALFINSLKNIIVGGEKFSNELLTKLRLNSNAEFYNMYGPTETTIWSTFEKAQKDRLLNIGKPIQNTQIYILDSNRKICPIGVKGELFIGGEGLARGYYKEETLTHDKFLDFQFASIVDQKIYKTGDLARWLPDGTLEHLGRLDNQVKINGFRIELGEIESIISSYSFVNQVVVIAVYKENGIKNLAAYFIASKTIDPMELRDYVKRKLPHFMVPSYFTQLKEFPLTPNGKINRKSLPDMNKEIPVANDYLAPRNEIENKLIAIWQEVLGVEKIGLKDNFFDLGGNSLLMIKMLNNLNKSFQTNISLLEGYNLPNILAISEQINSNGNDNLVLDEESKIEELYSVMEESYNLLNFVNDEK